MDSQIVEATRQSRVFARGRHEIIVTQCARENCVFQELCSHAIDTKCRTYTRRSVIIDETGTKISSTSRMQSYVITILVLDRVNDQYLEEIVLNISI